jgi:hypothetical protein
MSNKFRFVCATRVAQEQFLTDTALGRSLSIYQYSNASLRLFPNNRAGLPVVYNTALREAARDPAVLIFVHDDVHICDFFWPNHIHVGLRSYDILGLAGNRRRLPRQPTWNFANEQFDWDERENLTGVVGHGTGFPPKAFSFYGPPCQEVKLLDGVMLVAHSEKLLSSNLWFDERFDFHFYDMDFCRQAEASGLRMGTWTIAVVHESAGGINNDPWRTGFAKYLEKWGS